MSEIFLTYLIVINFLLAYSWTSTKKLIEGENFEQEFEVDMFCRNKNRLIKVERNTDFYPVDAHINGSVSMQCKYCEDEDDGLPKNWEKQKHIFTGNVTEVELNMHGDVTLSRVFVTKIHSLIIRNIQENDTALYFCRAPYVDKLEKSFNYFLDVMTHELDYIKGNLKTWKNYSEHYIEPLNARFRSEDVDFSINYMKVNISVFTDWSDWSDCDPCVATSRRTRTGRCRVKFVCDNPKKCVDSNIPSNDTFFDDKHNTESPTESSRSIYYFHNTNPPDTAISNPLAVKKDIIVFAVALSCRSVLLRALLPKIYDTTMDIPDFLLQDKCGHQCKGRSSKTAKYVRSIMLTQGAHLTLVCPDSVIDSEVRWEHNKKRLHPNEGFDYIPGSEEPRIYVDSFNTLYLFEVTEEESGNYTCFVDGVRMQEIKIIVLKRSVFFTKEFRRHLNYLAIVFLICFIAYLCGITLVCVMKRREERRRGPARRSEEFDSLLEESE